MVYSKRPKATLFKFERAEKQLVTAGRLSSTYVREANFVKIAAGS